MAKGQSKQDVLKAGRKLGDFQSMGCLGKRLAWFVGALGSRRVDGAWLGEPMQADQGGAAWRGGGRVSKCEDVGSPIVRLASRCWQIWASASTARGAGQSQARADQIACSQRNGAIVAPLHKPPQRRYSGLCPAIAGAAKYLLRPEDDEASFLFGEACET